MKRGMLALIVAAGALTLPIATSGGALKAQGGDDFRISFTLNSQNGEPRSLKNFRFSKLNGRCNGGVTVQVRGRFPFIKVNDRNRFSDTLRRPGRKVRVKGRVSGDLRKVTGRIRAQGNFPPNAQNCDTGKVPWKATR
jgi:hypothetical protein